MSDPQHPPKLVDGKLVALTDDEIAQRQIDQAAWEKANPPPPSEPEKRHEQRRAQ